MADLWEILAENGPDTPCLVAGSVVHTRRSLDHRANQVGHLLRDSGIGHGERVALYSRNRAEYLEGLFGCWKAGAVPVNVNWRYTAPELWHVLNDSDARAVIAERTYAPVLEQAVAMGLDVRRVFVLEDSQSASGSEIGLSKPEQVLALSGVNALSWTTALEGQAMEAPPAIARSADDRYLLYTGGTTGMPRGVVWRHEDFFRACVMSGDPTGAAPVHRPEDMAAHAAPSGMRGLVLAPLMHGGGQWPTLIMLYAGGATVLYCEHSFDADKILRLVSKERPISLAVVGDAMARPIAEAVLEQPDRYDVSSLLSVGNGGAMLSAVVKDELRRAFPGVIITDSFGASETGAGGTERIEDTSRSRPAFATNPATSVLDPETLDPVEPGSGAEGLLARRGHIPLGYWNDDAKTAAVFRTDRRGVRWVLPGDHATVDEAGRVVLMGRGSGCINTGGEKVFPEEVEAALRAHPAVNDAVVVGVPDPRWGQAVVAMVSLRSGSPPRAPQPDVEEIRKHCRSRIAGYKVPRTILFGSGLRTNTGKPDYAGVRRRVMDQLGIAESA